jgi:hypothetical protein
MSDLLSPLSHGAHVYLLDHQKHFWHQIRKTKQLLSA